MKPGKSLLDAICSSVEGEVTDAVQDSTNLYGRLSSAWRATKEAKEQVLDSYHEIILNPIRVFISNKNK